MIIRQYKTIEINEIVYDDDDNDDHVDDDDEEYNIQKPKRQNPDGVKNTKYSNMRDWIPAMAKVGCI